MMSEGLAYEETLPAYADGRPAYGEALPVSDAAQDASERLDRGKDWPLVIAFVTALVAAYGAIAYGLYVAANALL